jgi:hypothetical protein
MIWARALVAAVVGPALVFGASACGPSAKGPTTGGGGTAPTNSATTASIASGQTGPGHDVAPETIAEAPKLGYLERRADGSCWYGSSPGAPLAKVTNCPTTMASPSTKAPAKLEPAPSGGYLEKVAADGSCWWSLHAPYDCPEGSICKPDPPVDRVACP